MFFLQPAPPLLKSGGGEGAGPFVGDGRPWFQAADQGTLAHNENGSQSCALMLIATRLYGILCYFLFVRDIVLSLIDTL